MSSIVWKGGNDDETNSQDPGSDNDDDTDENSDDSDDSGGHESDNEDRIVSPQVAVKSGGGRSRKAEMELLRTNFDVTDEFRTPKSGETLREFYR